ncbi:hypothetical protein DQ04_11371000, partial [Trypanosoma grayi]|uniref:hypothetical protein n=1 Tax=Trypanosoma grayi TaxID=71804 RepID=UPI0004F3F37C
MISSGGGAHDGEPPRRAVPSTHTEDEQREQQHQPQGAASSSGRQAKVGGVDMDTIAALTVREQVDALAQALLREFMHRRGYTRTLQTFDCECPRNERTIASRQLMRQLLEVPSNAFPSRLCSGSSSSVGKTGSSNGIAGKKKTAPTFMEELCSYRLQKREVSQQQQQKQKQELGGNDRSAAATIVDPSDAEMEEWRTAASAAERRVAEATERHAQLLRERKERKREKKLKKQREKEKRKGKEEHEHRHHRQHRHRHDGDQQQQRHQLVNHRGDGAGDDDDDDEEEEEDDDDDNSNNSRNRNNNRTSGGNA